MPSLAVALGREVSAENVDSVGVGTLSTSTGDSATSLSASATAGGNDSITAQQSLAAFKANAAAIKKSFQSLQDVESGLAAVAALHDMYLATNANGQPQVMSPSIKRKPFRE